MSSPPSEAVAAPSELEGRFRVLLLALLLFLLVLPHAERLQPDLPMSLVFRLAVLLGAIRALSDRRATRWALALVGAFSLVSLAISAEPGSGLHLTGLATAAVFYAATLGLLVIAVFHRPGVTRDTLYGAACTYLLVALAFANAYQMLEVLVPGSFDLPDSMTEASLEQSFTYFSVVTLTTLGYGDIVPVSNAARSLVIVACMLGVLYPAILISRVVGLYVSGDDSIPFERPTAVARIWSGSSRFEALFSLQLLQILTYPYLPATWTRGIGVLIVIAALYALPIPQHRRAIGFGLAVPALLSWAEWDPGSGWGLAGAGFLAVFLFFAALVLLEHVFRQREVDREVIFGICCAYTMLGAAFASAYQLVLLIDPLAFSLSPDLPTPEIFPTMLYLSFVTLTTLGYGEILPLDGAAHTLASLEALVGILFPALLIARLVSLYRDAGESAPSS